MSSLQVIEGRTLAEAGALMRQYREAGEHLSFSAASTYLRCPRQYKYRYVTLAEPEFEADDLIFGIAMHKVVAGYYAHLKAEGEPLHVDKLLADWEIVFIGEIGRAKRPVRYKKPKDELLALGKVMLKVFAESIKPRSVVGVEVPFKLPLCDPRTGEVLPVELVGALDLIERDDDGNIVVADLKTAGKAWSDVQAEDSLQASLYAYAVAELLGLPEDADVLVRFDVLTKTKTPKLQQLHVSRGAGDYRRVLGLISDVHRAVEAKCFYINPTWACLGCQYHRTCDAEE